MKNKTVQDGTAQRNTMPHKATGVFYSRNCAPQQIQRKIKDEARQGKQDEIRQDKARQYRTTSTTHFLFKCYYIVLRQRREDGRDNVKD
jgi:hypothetical protein